MANNYRGYLLKVNGIQISHKFFQEYKTTPNKQTDLNPWTDTNGKAHRNVLPHLRTEIVFTTPRLYLEEKIELQEIFGKRIKTTVEYWNDEDNQYSEGEFYIPDVTFEVMMPYDDTVIYRPVTYTLIEY